MNNPQIILRPRRPPPAPPTPEPEFFDLLLTGSSSSHPTTKQQLEEVDAINRGPKPQPPQTDNRLWFPVTGDILAYWNTQQAGEAADDPSSRIADWQCELAASDETIDPSAAEGVGPSSIMHLVRQTCEFFRGLVRIIQRHGSMPSEICNSLRRSYETLMLWDDAYKVSDGGLDSVLALSSTIRTLTSKSLRRIAEQLIKDPSGVSKNLAAHAECLMGMDLLYKNPPPDPKPDNTGDDQASSPVDTEWKDWSADQIYRDRISQRFPCAQESLVARLGQASMTRYLRCKNKRDGDDAHPATDAEVEAAAVNATATPSKKWKDPGVGTSLGLQPSDRLFAGYAKTVMSYGQGNEKTRRIPSLSDEARKGEPFGCFICGKQVVAFNDAAWKQHLLSDLQPYICLEASCQQSDVFETRDSWTSHLGSKHYQDWAGAPCPLCGEQMKDGLVAITDHLRYHLEELALACGPSVVGSDSDPSVVGSNSAQALSVWTATPAVMSLQETKSPTI
ncbi:hypothetical protein RB600_008242 [Gaeumannomyces tritici]